MMMNNITVNKFKENLNYFLEQVLSQHIPLKIKNEKGADFIIINAKDWEREQETLYILQNNSLMQQILESSKTHKEGHGYLPNQGELDEIIGI